jgi:crotonobetainyl-CoA:carnitine CoA-transferase CaiB-like acyl-CoA transferase
MTDGPMAGIGVIELASWTFVPAAGSVLAEWGADVIKIEHPEGGDPQRGLISSGMVAGGAGGVNYLVEQPNHNKRSMGLDVRHPEGREILLELCRNADVFLTNWLPGQRQRAMVDIEDIRRVNPAIVYARGSGYGARGPDADKPGYDSSAFWARSGAAHSHTQVAGEVYGPTMSAAFGDLAGAQTIAGGIAAALLRRERTGETSVVDISLLGLGMWMMSPEIIAHKLFADAPAQRYTRDSAANPIANRYRTADDRVIQLVMLQSGRFWPELVTAIGRPELATDARFANPESLYEHRLDAIAILDEAFAAKTLADWRPILERLTGSWDAVQKPIELHDDAQASANGYLVEVDGAFRGRFPLVANPVQFDESHVELHPAPDVGEHTDEILAELGIGWDRVIELKVSGAVL